MRAALRNIYRLGIKELHSLRSDPVLALLIVYAFSYAVYEVATGVKFDVADAAVAVVDEDRSVLSQDIADAILGPHFRKPVEIGADEVDEAMNEDRYVFVLDFPHDLERDVLAGRRPTIQLAVDATAMTQAGNGAAYLQSIVARQVADFLRARGVQTASPINLVVRTKFNPNGVSAWFTSVMEVVNNITMLSIILAGAALIREREHGTLEHLLVMPVAPIEIMLAKIWANGLVIVVAALLSLWLVVHLLIGVPIAGSVTLFIAGAVIYQFSVTALGILLATFTSSMPQFGLLAMPVMIVMTLLSGSSTPLEAMPAWLRTTMLFSPSTHFVSFSQAVLYRDADLSMVWPELSMLTGIGAAFLVMSLLRFRRAIVSFQ